MSRPRGRALADWSPADIAAAERRAFDRDLARYLDKIEPPDDDDGDPPWVYDTPPGVGE
jgi:hypothetical protein